MRSINTKNPNVIQCKCGEIIEYGTPDLVIEKTIRSTPYYAIGVKCPSCSELHSVDVRKYDYSALIAPLRTTSKGFADLTPTEILEVFESGRAEEVFSTKDRRYITLKNGFVVELAPMGFYHDIMDNGERAPMTIGFVSLYGTDSKGGMTMNNTDTNEGGWERSLLRKWLNNDFYELLPDEWKEVVVPVVKLTADNSGQIKQIVDRVFLLSEIEVIGEACKSTRGEGEQYELFKSWLNRVKGYSDSKSGRTYWLRSLSRRGDKSFCYIYSSGNSGTGKADYYYGIAPCIAIGRKKQQTEDSNKTSCISS